MDHIHLKVRIEYRENCRVPKEEDESGRADRFVAITLGGVLYQTLGRTDLEALHLLREKLRALWLDRESIPTFHLHVVPGPGEEP